MSRLSRFIHFYTDEDEGQGGASSIIKTVKASLVHVEDALAKNAKMVKAYIEPVQSGSGDPSPDNVRPITGHTGVNVVRTGKNLLDPNSPYLEDTLIGTDGSQGSNSNFNTWRFSSPNTFTVSINVTETTNPGRVVVFNANGSVSTYEAFSGTVGRRAISKTLTSGQYALISIRKSATDYQLEVGTETTYAPYNGTTYSVNWNLLNLADSENGGINTSGANVNASNNWRSKGYIPIEAGKAYTLSASSTFADIVCRIYWYDSSKNFISPRVVENKKVTATAPNNAAYARYTYALSTDFTQSIAENGELQFEQGSDKTSYKPYCGTVYSGTLDLTTGVLTVTHFQKALKDFNFNYNTGSHWFTAQQVAKPVATSATVADAISSAFKVVSRNDLPNQSYAFAINDAGNLLVKDVDYSDVTAFKTALGNVSFVLPLATPLTYQLTPTQITMLLGENNLWNDANGDTEVTYLASS